MSGSDGAACPHRLQENKEGVGTMTRRGQSAGASNTLVKIVWLSIGVLILAIVIGSLLRSVMG